MRLLTTFRFACSVIFNPNSLKITEKFLRMLSAVLGLMPCKTASASFL